jgi:hypothetical protein
MTLISLKTIKSNVSCIQAKLTDFTDGQPDLGEVLENAYIIIMEKFINNYF